MKNIFYLLIIALIMGSCKATQITHLPKKEIISGVDFRKYTEKGFLFTPEKYNGEYESIGIINYLIMPEANREKIQSDSKSMSQWEQQPVMLYWKIEDVSIQNALEGIYNECIKMGADALVNFKADSKIEEYSSTIPPVNLIGYIVTGFAIKRK